MQVLTARIGGLILLLFLLVAGHHSTAYLIRGGDVYTGGNCKLMSILERKAAQTMSEKKMIGRRMGAEYGFMLMKTTTKEIDVIARDTRKSRMLKSREDHGAGFVAFTADYKGPRHHPPKNN